MTNTREKHTETPWYITYDKHEQANLIGADDNFVAICVHQCLTALIPVMEANARHIVKCVNSHDELVDIVKLYVEECEALGKNCQMYRDAKNLLTRLEKE